MKFIEGLHIAQETIRRKGIILQANPKITIPTRIPGRSLMLTTSNQGLTFECAAYAITSKIERDNWKETGIAKQIDPHPVYIGAKKIDGIEGEGTTLDAVFVSAQKLGLIKPDAKPIIIQDVQTARRCLHKYGCVVVGMMIDNGWMKAQPNGWVFPGTEVLGGHATAYCEYANDYDSYDAVQGSWGEKDGWRGFIRMEHSLFNQQFVYGIVWE